MVPDQILKASVQFVKSPIRKGPSIRESKVEVGEGLSQRFGEKKEEIG